MTIVQLPLAYIRWHVTTAWRDLWRLYTNLVWFIFNLFSIRLLTATLFSPWRRLRETRTKGSGGFIGSLIINTITRCVGAIVRLVVISIGSLLIILCTVVFGGVCILWIIAPLIGLASIIIGLHGLFNASLLL